MKKIRSILFYEKLGKPLETIFPEKLFMISDKNNLNEVIVQMVQAICIRKELSNDLCRQMLYKAGCLPGKSGKQCGNFNRKMEISGEYGRRGCGIEKNLYFLKICMFRLFLLW